MRKRAVRQLPPATPATDGHSSGDLAVITCAFNWAGFKRPAQNLHRFIRLMRATGIPTFGVEAYLPHQTPQTKGIKGWMQVMADPATQILFQKERMLNMAEKLVPDQFKKIAWLDCDLMFSNMRWAEDTSAQLDIVPFVQPFELAVWTDIDGREVMRKPSTLRMNGGMPMLSHPGFAMAARRSLWRECGGLFDKLIVGNGDTAIATAILNCDLPFTQTYSPQLMAEYMAWRSLVTMKADGKWGWTRGMVYHEWHGSLQDRRYAERNVVLKGVVPAKHLLVADNGLLAWKAVTPKSTIEYVKGYFLNRQEDGVTPLPETKIEIPHPYGSERPAT